MYGVLRSTCRNKGASGARLRYLCYSCTLGVQRRGVLNLVSRLEQTLNKPIVVLVVGVLAVALNVLLYFGVFLPRMTPLIAHINPIGTSLPEAISNLRGPEESNKSDSAANNSSGSKSDSEASSNSDSEVSAKSGTGGALALETDTSPYSPSGSLLDSPPVSPPAEASASTEASASAEASASTEASASPEASASAEASAPPPEGSAPHQSSAGSPPELPPLPPSPQQDQYSLP